MYKAKIRWTNPRIRQESLSKSVCGSHNMAGTRQSSDAIPRTKPSSLQSADIVMSAYAVIWFAFESRSVLSPFVFKVANCLVFLGGRNTITYMATVTHQIIVIEGVVR